MGENSQTPGQEGKRPEPEPKGRRGRRYHTPACGRATTSRCRCVCGGARHGELLKKSDAYTVKDGVEDGFAVVNPKGKILRIYGSREDAVECVERFNRIYRKGEEEKPEEAERE